MRAKVENLLAAIAGDEPTGVYGGYTACPVATGYGHLALAIGAAEHTHSSDG